jgi:hypothetical protein
MAREILLYPVYNDMQAHWVEDAAERMAEKELVNYASQLLGHGIDDEMELETAMHKAITALSAAHMPASHHFKKVFICVGHDIKYDWLVSNLGLRLIVMNADVSNPVVARLQIDMLSRKFI